MRGHALRGMFGGFFAGLFLAITLWIYAVIPFASNLVWILPLVGIVLGLALAAWAPFGSGAPADRDASPDADDLGDGGPYPASGTTLEQDAIETPDAEGEDHGNDT